MRVYEMEIMNGAGGIISLLQTGVYYATLRNKQRSQYRFEKSIFTTYVHISIKVPTKYIKRKNNLS